MPDLFGKASIIAGVGGVGFFAMSVLLLGVWPGRVLEEETRSLSPKHPLALTASEQRGREIYSRDGCAYCHTQQVRTVDSDEARFGEPTLAWETQFDYPHLWGTRRIGPDLSREGSRHPEDWQFSHLYAPRAIVPDSVMPAFPSMFDGAPDRPFQDARDLVAYIGSLGRARALAEPVSSKPTRPPALDTGAADPARGQTVYAQNCSGCHGPHGEGDGTGAGGLSPRPANLAAHEYSSDRVAFALWNGEAGTAMSGWRDLSRSDLAAVSRVVHEFHTASREPAPPEELLTLGEKVYVDHCAQCHGEHGAGDGSAVEEIAVAPANFVAQRASVAESLRVLRNGIAGTPMAPWNTKLSEAELAAVVTYIRGFYRP
ncbi:MAG TPA: cbb3-type cytochrome c oxidase subunit II [Bryobacteraceae bacterium]|nr:cbb3-type cytochrome c oxidase subunit II [Bryobacteraceae bacterium]